MLEFLSALLIGLGNILNTILPNSDIQTYLVDIPQTIQTGVRWLNWVFPVAQCLVFLAAELALLVSYVAVKWVMSKAITTTEKLVG